jgi:hypothetical protein
MGCFIQKSRVRFASARLHNPPAFLIGCSANSSQESPGPDRFILPGPVGARADSRDVLVALQRDFPVLAKRVLERYR